MLEQSATEAPRPHAGIKTLRALSGDTMGHAIGGHLPGPVIAVCGEGEGADALYQMLLEVPTLPFLKGTLLLLHSDNQNWAELKEALAKVGHEVIDHVHLLPFTLDAGLDGAANDTPLTLAYWSVLGRCADFGMISGRGIPHRHRRS